MNSKIVNIAFSINKKYIPYCAVTMASILKNARPGLFFDFYIFTFNDLNYELQNITVRGYSNYRIKNIVCDENLFQGVGIAQNNIQVTIDSSLRFFVPAMLTDINRCIVLDCDLIVNTDIGKLYEEDIQGFFMGGGSSL